jgi:hypothetical protein
MGRRILNRKELRADYEAAEERKRDQGEDEDTENEEEAELEDEEEAETGDADDSGEDEEGEPEAPKKRKAAAKVAKPRRARAVKITRMKVVWGVFNNSNQRVAVFEYPQRQEAEEMAAKLRADKKSTHFVQPVKEPIAEKTGV